MSTYGRKFDVLVAMKAKELTDQVADATADGHFSDETVVSRMKDWFDSQDWAAEKLTEMAARKAVSGHIKSRRNLLQGSLDLGDYDTIKEAMIPLGHDQYVKFGPAKLHDNRALLHNTTKNMHAIVEGHRQLYGFLHPFIAEQEKHPRMTNDQVAKILLQNKLPDAAE
ncbi:MAG: hypothetical protein ACRD3W_22795 [Terriglobales bacterium]